MEVVFKLNPALSLIIAFIIFPFWAHSQTELQQAQKAFELLKYNESIDLFTSHLVKNPNDVVATEQLIDAYIHTSNFVNAEIYLSKICKTACQDETMLKYAEVLILNNKKQEANLILQDYIKKFPSSEEYKRLFNSLQLNSDVEDQNYDIELHKTVFSSDVSDYCPAFYGNELIYTSQKGGKIDPWTNRSFSNMYVTKNQSEAAMLLGNLNGKFHNGACTFIDNNTMLFTRNNNKKGKNQDYNLILAVATKNGESWDFLKEFPYNGKDFSNAYPVFIAEQNLMIFSSDRPEGYGGMDLYYSMFSNGNWSTPINLGSDINTSKNEVFPTFFDNKLYFSTNGRAGLGGLDIFSANFKDGNVTNIQPLPVPFNSNRDDFGIISQDGLMSGYLSSNREGDGSIDKIFAFTKKPKKQLPKITIVSGKVIDEFTKIPLKEALVTMKNLLTGETQQIVTGEDGRFSFEGISDQEYTLTGIKNDIPTSSEKFNTQDKNKTYYFTLLHNDPRFSLEGFALHHTSQQGVPGVKVICYNKSNNTSESIITDEKGFFKFQLDQNSDFELSGTKDSHYTSVSDATTKGLNRSTTLYVKLFLTIEEVIIGETRILGKETFGGFDFDPIYYDLDKADIRPDAIPALTKVIDFLIKNPSIEIELGSHTDSRSDDQYNLSLSDRRANSAVNYIVSKGINTSRIKAKGYGEALLVNYCKDGVKCTEDLHQQNRRTEIKVIGINEAK